MLIGGMFLNSAKWWATISEAQLRSFTTSKTFSGPPPAAAHCGIVRIRETAHNAACANRDQKRRRDVIATEVP